jgi:hypothetical protein
MDKREAQKVIEILLECDGGCAYCAAEQIKLFCQEFPTYMQEAKEGFLEKFSSKELDKIEQRE